MKIQILLLSFLFLFSGCQITQKAQTNETTNEVVSNQEKLADTTEIKESENEKPNVVDDSKFLPIKINRTDSNNKFLLKIDVQYPQLKQTKNNQESKFNQYVKRQVDEQIVDFKKFLVDKNKDVKSKIKDEYEINLDYKVDYFSAKFTSVLMNWNGFSGYLNMDYFPSTINFDLKKGKALELKDIFEPNSKYLEKLSESSQNILRKTCLSCGCGDGINAGDPLPEELTNEKNSNSQVSNPNNTSLYIAGTKPVKENFSNWSIVSDGLKITFGEYQVGPGCIGIIDIKIPFKDLQPILRKDLKFD
jgi:Protein of unknown function (DUF3298)